MQRCFQGLSSQACTFLWSTIAHDNLKAHRTPAITQVPPQTACQLQLSTKETQLLLTSSDHPQAQQPPSVLPQHLEQRCALAELCFSLRSVSSQRAETGPPSAPHLPRPPGHSSSTKPVQPKCPSQKETHLSTSRLLSAGLTLIRAGV